MTPKHQRLSFALFGVVLLVAASLLILNRFSEHLVFFFTPTQLMESQKTKPTDFIRLGGLVKEGSIEQDGIRYQFIVTDYKQEITVHYEGVPPALFREGQGVVVEGEYLNPVFHAKRLLAKHDENYMPPEVANALRENGYWKDENTQHPPAPDSGDAP